jgi:predicted O-methyltransferase YrrM
MSSPLVSVVIPCYNGSAYLDDCSRSVLEQTRDCEVIVIDDGSTDETLDRAKALVAEHPTRALVACQGNQGPAAARNTGLRLARGKYVAFLDVDDQYLPGFFAAAVPLLEADPSVVMVTCRIELVESHRPVEAWQVQVLERCLPGNLIVRTDAARRVCGFPLHPAFRGPGAGEDVAFRRQVSRLGKTLKLDRPFYRYRARRGSHFDFFLDRVTLQDGRLGLAFLSEEERNGSLEEANRLYDESVRELAVAATVETLRTSLTAAAAFERLRSRLARVEGFLHEIEGFMLYCLAGAWPVEGRVVEVGSFKGRSTCWLASGCQEAGRGRVAAVDHFRGSPEHQPGGSHPDRDVTATGSTRQTFDDNVKQMGLADWVEVHAGGSAERSASWTEPIRLLFLDGDHAYEAVEADFLSWSRCVVCHGLVVFHDVGVWPGVTKLYTQVCRDRDHWKELCRVNSLGVLEKLA